MPLNYNVKQTDSGTSGGYNTAFTIKPPKKGKPTNNWFFQTPVNQIKQPAPAPAVNSVAIGDPSVQSFINLMRGTALSMPTFDPYETPLVGDPYDHGTYVATTAPNVNPNRQKNSPQDYFDRIVLNGRTYAVPNQMLNFAKDYPWDTLPSWYAPPADFTGSPEWKEVTGPPADNGAPTGGGWGGGGWGGGGGGFTPMPSSPRYTGYGGGYNPSRSPRPAYYQGRYGSSGGGGGYVGSQSQRGAWYGALLQWNI